MKKLSFFLILYISGIFLYSQAKLPDLQKPEIISGRFLGQGGSYTTLEAGTDTVFTNPAAFAFLKKRLLVMRAGITTSGNVPDFFNLLIQKNKEKLFEDYFGNLAKNDLYLNTTGPLAIAFTDKNFGFGIFNRFFANSNFSRGNNESFLIGGELFLTGGYGGTVYDDGVNRVSLGLQMKGFFQTFIYTDKIPTPPFQNDLLKQFNLVLDIGFGIDTGFLYKYKNYFFLGFTCRDLYTPVFRTYYKDFEAYKNSSPSGKTQYKAFLPDLTVGIGSIPVYKGLYKTVSSLSVYSDYRNILQPVFDKSRNPLLNIAAGSEIVFHEVLYLKLGLSELYPQGGIGFDFTYFTLDFSGFVKERGYKIWEKPLIVFGCNLSFEY